MARTYKKMHKHRRKFTRAGVGSHSFRAAKTIHSVLKTDASSSNLRKYSAKKIQHAHKAFDFATDDCTICLEKNRVRSKVAPISCGHGLHKQCLDDLLKSKPFETLSNRKCPMCRNPGPEFQVIPERPDEDAVLERQIREILETLVESRYLSQVLATPENINRLIRICKIKIRQEQPVSSDYLEITSIIRRLIYRIMYCWGNLTENLDTINRSIRTGAGQIKTRIGKPTLESLRERYLPFVIAGRIALLEYGINIPATETAQITVIENLFREKNIDMPSQEQITGVYRSIMRVRF